MKHRVQTSISKKTITALQIFGALPCVAKCLDSSHSGDIVRMEVSQPMWSWCLLLRVLYVVGHSVITLETMHQNITSYVTFFARAGTFLMYYLMTFNIFFAPLKWKSNIRLLNHLLQLRYRIGYSKQQNNSMTKSRAVFGFSVVVLLVYTSMTLLVPIYGFFFKTIVTFVGIYFLIQVVLQVMFFQYSCSTIENYVPAVTASWNSNDIMALVTIVKKVRVLNSLQSFPKLWDEKLYVVEV